MLKRTTNNKLNNSSFYKYCTFYCSWQKKSTYLTYIYFQDPGAAVGRDRLTNDGACNVGYMYLSRDPLLAVKTSAGGRSQYRTHQKVPFPSPALI